MPSRWIRKGTNKLKKCSERRTDSCGTETDGCCGVIACVYCIEFDAYSGLQYGTATFTDIGWEGTIAGSAFFGYWERNYETDECEFIVTLDGEEVYRKSCYEGQSCRDSSDSATVTIDYEEGTLTWTKYLSRPLPVVTDPVTGCRVHFCGTCHCTTECLCIAINTAVVEGYGSTQYAGEICDTAYSNCEGPQWVGSVGGYDIDLQLDADEYDGSCILHGTIAGEAVSISVSAGCSSIDETFTLYAGDTIRVTSKVCFCPTDEPGICMCNRGFGTSPTITFVSNNAPGTVHTVVMSYSSAITDPGITCAPISPCQGYTGRFDGILATPMGGTRTEGIEFRLVCSIECSGYCLYYKFDSAVAVGNDAWCRRDMFSQDCVCPATVIYQAQNIPTGCDPDPWSYQIPEFVFEEDPTNCV